MSRKLETPIARSLKNLSSDIYTNSLVEDKPCMIPYISDLNAASRNIISGSYDQADVEFFNLCLEKGTPSLKYLAEDWKKSHPVIGLFIENALRRQRIKKYTLFASNLRYSCIGANHRF